MIRLKDIAERAGVSVMTVSKVLRDAPDISVETKGRIRRLADEMGYVPDALAQGLRTRKTRLIGLLIPGVTNPVYVRVLMAIEELTTQGGYDLVLCHTLNDPAREEKAIRRLISRRADGMIIVPVHRLAEKVSIYDELASHKVPTVILGGPSAFCRQFANVQIDEVESSSMATRHLLALGHKRIAFFTGPSITPWAQDRLEGYRRALREVQLPVDDHLIFNAGSTIEEGEKAAQQLLKESPGATAIQASNDLSAMGAANFLLNQGISIPKQISIVGFGNFLASEFFRVPLTTVKQPKYRLGVAAVETLATLIRGEKPEPRRFGADLAVRASTAPPAAA